MRKVIIRWLVSNPRVRRGAMKALKNPRIRRAVVKGAVRMIRRR